MITIYGASDDLIEVEGDISEEFGAYEDSDEPRGHLIAVSDGTVLRVTYTNAGIWRITPVFRGTAALEIKQTTDDGHTDTATLDGDVAWVVHGIAYVARR